MSEQITFFASLDFPGRTTLTLGEIAEKTGYTAQHIADFISEGVIVALDGRGKGSSRASMRVPVESYRNFIVARMTGGMRDELIRALPESTRAALMLEIFTGLPAAARPGALRSLREAMSTTLSGGAPAPKSPHAASASRG
jgi:hypothetical protein